MPVVNMEPVQNTAPPQPGPGERSGSPAPAGENLISNELLISIADYLTVSGDQEISGLVNINTASATVLGMLSGMNAQLAEAIVAYRQSAGFFDNIACLLNVPGMTREIFKGIASRVTARSETFRITCEGKTSSARKRIQVVVHFGTYSIQTLSYREDL
jgi:competence ComEA-like helix-hairpin-helix protein